MLFSKMLFYEVLYHSKNKKSISCVKNPKNFKIPQDIDFLLF